MVLNRATRAALRHKPVSRTIRQASGQSATLWVVAGQVSGSCQQAISNNPIASASRAPNTRDNQAISQQATAHQPQHRTQGECDAHHRKDPRQIAALIAVAQHGLGHHGNPAAMTRASSRVSN